MRRLSAVPVGLCCLALSILPATAAELTLACGCASGGANSATAEWLSKSVIPAFTAKMKAAGKDVSVALKEFVGRDAVFTQQTAIDIAADGGADVTALDGFMIADFAVAGWLKPLDAVAGKPVDDWDGWSHMVPGTRAIMTYDGKYYGVPEGTDVRMIFTRKDLLKKAGIDPDHFQPKSWDDLLSAARALKKAGVEYPLQLDAGVAMGEATTMQGYYMALLGTGEALQDKDGKWIVSSPGILATLKLYKTIYVDEKLGDQQAQLQLDGRDQTFANFRDGKTGLLVEGDWFYRSVTAPGSTFAIKDRNSVMGWAKMPAEAPGKGIRGQDFVTISGGTGFVLNPNTRDPADAWALLAFMNSKEQLEAFQKYQPEIMARDDVPTPNDPFLVTTAKTLLPLTTARPNNTNYTKVSAEVQRMTKAVVSGEESPEAAMAQFKTALVEILGTDDTVSE
jgi:multiple sugar transport system substrate-binding protein